MLPAASAAFATRWLAERGLKRGQYVVLGLGARRPKKQPTSEQVLAWSAHFKQRWGLDTVFMWTPGKSGDPLYPGDDAWRSRCSMRQSRGLAPQLHPFRGPIAEALGLIWSARTSLFPDSGLMHFAAASPGGVLGFFAETGVSPAPAQWAPRGAKAAWLEAPQERQRTARRPGLRSAGALALAVDRRIERRVVVHLELAVDLETALAARALGEQPVEAGRQVRPLLVQARQFREAALDVRAIDVVALASAAACGGS